MSDGRGREIVCTIPPILDSATGESWRDEDSGKKAVKKGQAGIPKDSDEALRSAFKGRGIRHSRRKHSGHRCAKSRSKRKVAGQTGDLMVGGSSCNIFRGARQKGFEIRPAEGRTYMGMLATVITASSADALEKEGVFTASVSAIE